MTVDLNKPSLIDIFKKERGYNYLQTCMQVMPCIDWLDFCAKMYRRNKKATTALMCCRAMCYFDEAYKATKKGKLNDKLAKVIAKQDVGQALELIDSFVSYCDVNKQLLAGATSVHVRAIKRVLRYAGVKIDKDDFADKVVMPKSTSAIEEPPKDTEIRAILNYSSPRLRGAIMVLNDSGLGRSEVIRLRPKDFHFDEDPVRIITRRFKTGEYIETFCTKETANTVQQIISNKNLKLDDYIFVKKLGKNAGDKFSETYIRALKKAGLDQKLEVRIGDEVREHRYYKFHLHIYRKRWFTKAINVVPAYVAHAMLGRKQYLDQYLAHPLNERQAFYKKIAKHVGIFETKADKAEVLAQASQILGVELTDEKLAQLRDTLNFAMRLSGDNIKSMKDLLGAGKQD